MNLVGTALLLTLAVLQSASAQNATVKPIPPTTSITGLPDGQFVGLEKLAGMGEPHASWFHENTLIVRGAEVILDMQPVVFHSGKKTYSASDGGFLTYRGRLFYKSGQLFVSLRLFQSDYIVFPIGPHECEPYSRLVTSPVSRLNGVIEINGVHYKPASIAAGQLSELLRLLHDVPAEYDGKHPYESKYHLPPCN